jgi:hypothetical protein
MWMHMMKLCAQRRKSRLVIHFPFSHWVIKWWTPQFKVPFKFMWMHPRSLPTKFSSNLWFYKYHMIISLTSRKAVGVMTSPCLWASFHPPYPLFQPKVRKFLLNLSMKCWNSAFNAQGWRVIIGRSSENICSRALKALRKKDRQDETQFPTKIDGFLSFTPPLNANVLFCRFFQKSHPCMTKLRVLVLCFPYFTNNSIMLYKGKQLTMHVECDIWVSVKQKVQIWSVVAPTLRRAWGV